MTEQLLRVPEVAAVLACHRSGVYRLFNSGDLKSVQVNGKRRVLASELDRYIRQIVRDADRVTPQTEKEHNRNDGLTHPRQGAALT